MVIISRATWVSSDLVVGMDWMVGVMGGCSVAEPEPVELKLFATWSWSRSQNYLFNKYFLQSVWRMLG